MRAFEELLRESLVVGLSCHCHCCFAFGSYAAISGLGYVHPYRNFTGALPASAWSEYWARARCYMQRLGTNTTGVYTDAQLPFDRSKQDPTTARIVQACGVDVCSNLVLGMGRDEGRNVYNGNYLISPAGSKEFGNVSAALVSSILTRWPLNFSASTAEENVQWLVGEILGQVPDGRCVLASLRHGGGERGAVKMMVTFHCLPMWQSPNVIVWKT